VPYHFGMDEWLHGLLSRGESVLTVRPGPLSAAGRSMLRSAFEAHAAAVAKRHEYAEAAAVAATGFLADCCWCLVAEPVDIAVLREPRTEAEHLSADTVLRFAPAVLRRAQARAIDALVTVLATTLRAWPLSGVLADLTDAPTTPPDFDHDGLAMLYAERLLKSPRFNWLPAAGRPLEWAERVFAAHDKPLPRSSV
jgi:MoxR-vWA-beta-propeller ternary system domain bpX4